MSNLASRTTAAAVAALLCAPGMRSGAQMTAPVLAADLTLNGSQTVPMRLVDGRPVVEVTINGKGPYAIGIETGAPMAISLDQRIVRQIATDSSPRSMRADSVRIGGLLARNVRIFSTGSQPVWGIDGLAGLDFFHDLLLTVDMGAKRVSFSLDTLAAVDGMMILPMKRRGSIVGFDAEIASRTIPLTLDTQGGGVGLMCGDSLARTLEYVQPLAVLGEARIGGVGAPPVTTYAGRTTGTLAFGSITQSRPIISTLPLPEQIGCLYGVEYIKDVPFSLDLRTQRVRIGRTAALNTPGALFLTGLSIRPDSGAFRVGTVRPGSPTEAAGLRAGDVVVSIAGKVASIASTAPSAVRELAQSGKPFAVTIRRDGAELTISIAPRLLIT